MGLSVYSLTKIKNILDLLPKNPKILFLSYPDLLVTPKQLNQIFKRKFIGLKYRSDSDEILNWHKGYKYILNGIFRTEDVFNQLNCECTFYDLGPYRQAEEIKNLNDEWHEYKKFDLVIDNVLQHCFNVGQALLNIHHSLDVNSCVMHLHPYLWPNQGFHCFSTEFYWSWYDLGYEVIDFEVHDKNKCYKMKQWEKAPEVGKKSKIIVIAKKKEPSRHIHWPIQRKFQVHASSKIYK